MQRLEVRGAVRLIYKSLGVKGLTTGLFNDALSSTDHAASNFIIMIIWKQPGPNFRKHSNTFLEVQGKTKDNPNHDTRSWSHDMNPRRF